MQAVILAGGLGTRLLPLTEEIPKPMVPVAGAPYLEHQLRLLRRQAITDVVLLTGYLGRQIEEYFGNGDRMGMRIRYSRETSPLGTGGALGQAADLLAEEFLVIYGDSFLPIDYPDVLRLLAAHPQAAGLVTVYDNRAEDAEVRNNIAVDQEGFVTRYDKDASAAPGLAYVEAGVLAFRRSVLAHIPAGVASLEKQVFPALIARRQLIAYQTGQRFYDIGTPERLRRIERFLLDDYYAHSISH